MWGYEPVWVRASPKRQLCVGLQGSVFMVQRRNSGEAATGPWRPMRVRTEAWSVWSDPTDGLKLHAGSDRKLSGWPGWPPSTIESTNNENWTTERWRKVAASFLHKQEQSVQHSDKFEVLTLIFKRSQSSRASVRCAGQTSRIHGGSTPQLAEPKGSLHTCWVHASTSRGVMSDRGRVWMDL